VEVVLLQQFGAAKAQHVRMDVAARQLSAQVIGAPLRLIEGHRGLDPGDLAIVQYPESG
jgi:hypothetical protein